jgi:aminoglycoside phosphotransferase family enzyme/predicted kinase
VLPTAAVETHISRLFFVDDHVYKCSRAVDLGFIDLHSLEARRATADRELTVNRRFAPDVYEGTAVLHGPDGQPCEHFVVMRRLPPERSLTALLAGPDAADHVRDVTRVVAAMHAVAPRSPEIEAAGSAERVARLWDDNWHGVRPFAGSLLPEADLTDVDELARRYLAGRTPLLEQRVADGRIRDGHGDLLADDIYCLPDGPRILDALAFRDDLRHGDVLLDAGFLAMDLERLGRPELAARFLDWYREFSAETHPDSLAHFYVAYRALVRAKVRALRWHETGDPSADTDARALVGLAHRHLRRATVRLVVIGGLPGTGKSTLARELAAETGWCVLGSDEIRKELAGIPEDHPAAAPPDQGLYRPELRSGAYRTLVARAQQLMARGESVIVDASWASAHDRALACAAAHATASDLVEVRCVAPEDVAERRLRQRRPSEAHGSDATVEIARHLARTADAWPTAIPIDTDRPVAVALRDVLQCCDRDALRRLP